MSELRDYVGRTLRLTEERLEQIEHRPEMREQVDRIAATLEVPDTVRESDQDDAVYS